MGKLQESVNAIEAEDQELWRMAFLNNPQGAAKLIEAYGAPDWIESAGSGFAQGVTHGFVDDMERMDDGVAKSQMMAQAAHPVTHALTSLAGTAAAGAATRFLPGRIGKERAKGFRASSKASGGVSAADWATKNAKRADEIENKWATWGMKPAHRGMLIDAGHGAAWGYGGVDVAEDEDALSLERLGRAGTGTLASVILAPLATSGVVAAGNTPLAFGGRRIGSAKMLEPMGVTRQNPKGNIREAILAARARDENNARGSLLPDDTGRTENAGLLNRDTSPPLESSAPKMRELADLILAVRAPDRIADLKGKQREAAASQIRSAYPPPPSNAPPTVKPVPNVVDADNAGSWVQLLDGYESMPKARLAQILGMDSAAPHDFLKRKAAAKLSEARASDPKSRSAIVRQMNDRGGYQDEDIARAMNFNPDDFGDNLPKYIDALDGRPEAVGQRKITRMSGNGQPAPITIPDTQLDDLARVFTREQGPDRPVLESLFGRLQVLDKQDPTVMPRMKAIMARVLSENELNNPAANDAAPMRAFINRFGMAGNQKAGREPVVASARAAAERAFPTARLDEAILRTTSAPNAMRPRHADNLEAEMQAFQPPAYTDPADARRGGLVARGDDQAFWLNPGSYYRDLFRKEDKVPNWAVQAAGGVSGPIAWAIENLSESGKETPEWDKQITGPARASGQPARPDIAQAIAAAGMGSQPRPAQPPQVEAQPPAPEIAARFELAPNGSQVVAEVQAILSEIGVRDPGLRIDGVAEAPTLQAMRDFAAMTNMPGDVTPDRVLARLKAYPRETLAQDLAAYRAQSVN